MPIQPWSTKVGATKEYPVRILGGYFQTANGDTNGLPVRNVHDEWGMGYSDYNKRDLGAPVRLVVTWFSYREDAFYHGDFELPSDFVAQRFGIDELPPYATEDHFKRAFTVGVAPNGMVVVWLLETNNKWIIFEGQATQVFDIPWEEVIDAPDFSKEEALSIMLEDYVDDAKDSPQLNDPTYWKRLHAKKFNYDIIVENAYTPYYISAYFYNKAHRRFYGRNTKFTSEPLSVLDSIHFAFFFPDHGPVVSIDNINQEEFEQAITTLAQQKLGAIRVVVNVDNDLRGWQWPVTLRIENDKNSIYLKNYTLKRTDNTEGMERVKTIKEQMRYMNQWDKPATP